MPWWASVFAPGTPVGSRRGSLARLTAVVDGNVSGRCCAERWVVAVVGVGGVVCGVGECGA